VNSSSSSVKCVRNPFKAVGASPVMLACISDLHKAFSTVYKKGGFSFPKLKDVSSVSKSKNSLLKILATHSNKIASPYCRLFKKSSRQGKKGGYPDAKVEKSSDMLEQQGAVD
jgi:hypothetical protein